MSFALPPTGGRLDFPPNIEEGKHTAFTQYTQVQLGAVPQGSSVIIPFDRQGKDPDRPYDYPSAANRPLSDMSLGFVREWVGYDPLIDESWKGMKDNLLSHLTTVNPALASWIAEQSLLPADEQTLEYVVFAQVLNQLSTAMAWLAVSSLSQDNDSAAIRNSTNLALPAVMRAGIISNASISLAAVEASLLALGPNFTLFDAYANVLRNTASNLQTLSELSALKASGKLPDNFQELALANALSIHQLYTSYSSTFIGDDLQTLGPTLLAMDLAAASLTLNESHSLMMATWLATFGANPSASELAIIGNSFNTASNGISLGFAALLLNENQLGAAYLLENTSTLALTAAAVIGNFLAAPTFGNVDFESDADRKVASRFYAELVLTLISHSDIVPTLFGAIADAASVTGKDKDALVNASNLAFLLTLCKAVSKGDDDTFQRLLEDLHHPLEHSLAAISTYVDNALQEGSISGEKAEGLQVFLQQAAVSLESQDYEGFVSTYTSALGLLGIEEDEMNKDFNNLSKLSDSLSLAWTIGGDDNTNAQTAIQVV